MTAIHRRRTIERLLAVEGEFGLSALAQRFKVSEMTICRDLEALEVQCVLRRVGGRRGIGVSRKAEAPTFVTRALQESQGKANIGQSVASRLCNGDAIYLDGSSTALVVAHALRQTEVKLAVITRNPLAALELGDQQRTDVIILGGRRKPTVRSSLEHDLRSLDCRRRTQSRYGARRVVLIDNQLRSATRSPTRWEIRMAGRALPCTSLTMSGPPKPRRWLLGGTPCGGEATHARLPRLSNLARRMEPSLNRNLVSRRARTSLPLTPRDRPFRGQNEGQGEGQGERTASAGMKHVPDSGACVVVLTGHHTNRSVFVDGPVLRV